MPDPFAFVGQVLVHDIDVNGLAGLVFDLEDAAVLARCLLEFGDVDTALRIYEATRKPRASAVQQGSSANNWMRNETNPDWLYGYDPWTAPLAEPMAA